MASHSAAMIANTCARMIAYSCHQWVVTTVLLVNAFSLPAAGHSYLFALWFTLARQLYLRICQDVPLTELEKVKAGRVP